MSHWLDDSKKRSADACCRARDFERSWREFCAARAGFVHGDWTVGRNGGGVGGYN